ncbi:MAG: hypothetical protein A2498_00315 [Lentisphaerae bacterium RIFOXYC12_FULL_60_16]|nr:MAG: hypothetical protein A2498_00315 [Lentisphaerae bacterium RIFOXYC12_FULL_60_16]OGV85093.1 MAG: hypothetical protein A2340_09600 [Lentisphaerae bacterium RIFOXYB12_FULL_60_10]
MNMNDSRGREVVRDLARQVGELARHPHNAEHLTLWRDVNSLRKPARIPVICHPGTGAWEELIPPADILSTDPELAGLENHFRQILCKWEMGDDTVVQGYLPVSTVMQFQGDHFWGLPIRHIRPADASDDSPTRTAWRYEPPLKEESDIEKIIPPSYCHDPAASRERVGHMQDLLGDILPVREVCSIPGPGAWLHGWATELRGVEQLLVDLMDRPEWVHRLMRTLMEGFLGLMDQFEQAGVLTLNNTGLYACDDLPGAGYDPVRVRLKDLWGRGESQEFHGVGPAQYGEFLLQYQKPILERFGLTYYGCCEDLTSKIPQVLSIPNLRKFVCSAWTDLGRLADAVGTHYCIEWRQKATDVVYATDLSGVRKHLESGLARAPGCRIMIVLQELETVNHNRKRLTEWAALAKAVGSR